MNLFECVLKTSSGGGSGADLIVTCDSVFAGATITCTDGGSNTFTEVCPSVSPYTVTFESIPTGTYTVSGIYNGQTFSTTVTITDFTALLAATPDGSTVTPVNDIQIWLHCANIWDKTYTTIAQVLSDTSTLLALISDTNAVDYMARSTSWASSVCANQTAMGYIGNNNYCADKLLSNSTWLTAICNSIYFESVLNVKVPTMTSNTTPTGVAFASSEAASSMAAWYAFDNTKNATFWASTGNTNAQIGYDFGSAKKIKALGIINSSYQTAGATPWYTQGVKDFIFQASNDNSTWVDLLENTAAEATSLTQDFEKFVIENPNSYRYYRVFCKNNYGQATNIVIAQLQFWGR